MKKTMVATPECGLGNYVVCGGCPLRGAFGVVADTEEEEDRAVTRRCVKPREREGYVPWNLIRFDSIGLRLPTSIHLDLRVRCSCGVNLVPKCPSAQRHRLGAAVLRFHTAVIKRYYFCISGMHAKEVLALLELPQAGTLLVRKDSLSTGLVECC